MISIYEVERKANYSKHISHALTESHLRTPAPSLRTSSFIFFVPSSLSRFSVPTVFSKAICSIITKDSQYRGHILWRRGNPWAPLPSNCISENVITLHMRNLKPTGLDTPSNSRYRKVSENQSTLVQNMLRQRNIAVLILTARPCKPIIPLSWFSH